MEGKRIVAIGGTGFLASFVAERLRHTSWCNEIFVPRGGSMNFGKSGPPSLCIRMPGRTS